MDSMTDFPVKRWKEYAAYLGCALIIVSASSVSAFHVALFVFGIMFGMIVGWMITLRTIRRKMLRRGNTERYVHNFLMGVDE